MFLFAGGMIGFSLQPAAVQRWVMTAHERTSISENTLKMAGLDENNKLSSKHKEHMEPRMLRDEEDVTQVLDTIAGWRNPFLPSQNLVSLSSGIVVTEKNSQSILTAQQLGRDMLLQFIDDRLVTGKVELNRPLSKLKLKFLPDPTKTKGKNVPLCDDRNLFARLLVIAQKRTMNLKTVLSYELGKMRFDDNLFLNS